MLRFRDEPLVSEKRAGAWPARASSPVETLARIRPHLASQGVTRLANITGLDRVGLPVTLAIRPNGKVLSVSAGKGLTLEAALVSGAMEAMELTAAEDAALPALIAPARGPSRPHLGAHEVPRNPRAPLPETWPIAWVEGWDLAAQREVWAPRGVVTLGPGHAGVGELFAWRASSSGLASGNDLTEAALSALLELVERDAVALAELRWARRPPVALDLTELTHPAVRATLDRLEAAELLPVVIDLSGDVGLPVYAAWLLDRATPAVGVFKGYGCHLDPAIALVRALTEAAQSRLVIIAGSRDDLYRTQAAELRSASNAEAAWAWARGLRHAPVTPLADLSTPTTHGDLEIVLAALGRIGLDRVALFDLSPPGLPVRVARALVPGLATLDSTPATLSPRQTARLEATCAL